MTGRALLAQHNPGQGTNVDGTTTFYAGDQLGSARLLTNTNGYPIWEETYYPYGVEYTDSGSTANSSTVNNYKFAGMERDGESTNDYTMFRFYGNAMGRWLSPDPLGGDISNPQSLNRYAYVGNDPVDFVDPFGLFIRPIPPTPPTPTPGPQGPGGPGGGPSPSPIQDDPGLQTKTGPGKSQTVEPTKPSPRKTCQNAAVDKGQAVIADLRKNLPSELKKNLIKGFASSVVAGCVVGATVGAFVVFELPPVGGAAGCLAGASEGIIPGIGGSIAFTYFEAAFQADQARQEVKKTISDVCSKLPD